MSLEKSSTHPLAHAIMEKAKEENIEALPIEEFRSLTGSGLQGRFGQKIYYVGNVKFFEEVLKIKPDGMDEITRLRNEGKTVVLLGTKNGIEGLIGIQDQVRPGVAKVIKELHALGLKTAMLTGDNDLTAQAIAKHVGIDDVRADLKPEDKLRAVESLTQKFGPIAMVAMSLD